MFTTIRSHLLFGLLVVASWYHHGRVTANGELFEPEALTAAHRSLPFNTVVLVERPDNGKSVLVRINDRGPYIKGRTIDLSQAAAKALDMEYCGLAKVKITIVGVSPRRRRHAGETPSVRQNARK